MGVQRFSGFSMLPQGLSSFVRPGPRSPCSSKNIREKPMTCWSLWFLRGSIRFQFRAVSKRCQNSVAAIKPRRKLHICSEGHGIAALSWKVGPLILEQPENALSAWRQHQHNVTCYNLKVNDKRRSYHGRSTVFRVFNAAPRASILCQTRAVGSLFFQQHQRESDDMPKLNVFTGWFDFCMEVSDSSSLPCRKDAKILLQPSNHAENCTFVRKAMGLRRWVGKSDLQPWSNLRMPWVLEE